MDILIQVPYVLKGIFVRDIPYLSVLLPGFEQY